jgi:deferrochelatase/peroxidase EfeB
MTHPSTEQQSPKEPKSVLGPATSAAIFLVVTIEPGGESVVREVLADLAGLRRSVGFRVPPRALRCAAGISSDAWDRLFDGECPADQHPFREVAADETPAVSAPGDRFIGYSSHDASAIELNFQESLTFLMCTGEPAVALSAKGF